MLPHYKRQDLLRLSYCISSCGDRHTCECNHTYTSRLYWKFVKSWRTVTFSNINNSWPFRPLIGDLLHSQVKSLQPGHRRLILPAKRSLPRLAINVGWQVSQLLSKPQVVAQNNLSCKNLLDRLSVPSASHLRPKLSQNSAPCTYARSSDVWSWRIPHISAKIKYPNWSQYCEHVSVRTLSMHMVITVWQLEQILWFVATH